MLPIDNPNGPLARRPEAPLALHMPAGGGVTPCFQDVMPVLLPLSLRVHLAEIITTSIHLNALASLLPR
jgi:hypothetical protein